MTEKKLTRAEHAEMMQEMWGQAPTDRAGWFAAVDYAIAHGMEVAPDPLPEPPEPERVTVSYTEQGYLGAARWNVAVGGFWCHMGEEEGSAKAASWTDLHRRDAFEVHAEPSYWRFHPEYAEQYEAWKAAQA